jgi:hypothetical protein
MLDTHTFLTALYVIVVDDSCHSHPPKKGGPPQSPPFPTARCLPLLSSSPAGPGSRANGTSTATLATTCEPPSRPCPIVLSSIGWFASIRGTHRRDGFVHLATPIGSSGTFPLRSPGWLKAMPVGDAKRRGAGRLAGYADIGWSNALGWYEGLRLLAAVAPSGVITGFASASTKEQPLAETFFALRARPNPGLLRAWERRPRGRTTWSTRASRVRTTTEGGSFAMGHGLSVPAQTQRPQGMVQALETLGGWHPPDRGDGLRRTFQCFWLVAGAASQAEGLAGAVGGEGSPARLLRLAQRATRSPPVGLRRLVGMVISELTPSV